MIHDEGIEKAITWLCGFDDIRKRQMIMAIIGGLRELQIKRTEIASLHAAHEADVALIEELVDLITQVALHYTLNGKNVYCYSCETWGRGLEQIHSKDCAYKFILSRIAAWRKGEGVRG